MAQEIEAKFRVESHEPLRRRLIELNATRLSSGCQRDAIFDRTDGSLRAAGCGLRIRTSTVGGTGSLTTTLTFKGPVVDGPYKSREELNVAVDDADTTAQLLMGLGFRRILLYEKRRESWQLDRCRVELDEPPRIGLFVEIEGPDETAIRVVQEKLGLGKQPVMRSSYPAMVGKYCADHGLPDRLTFSSAGGSAES